MSLSAVPLGAHLELRLFPNDSNTELFLEQVTVRWSRGQEFGVAFTTVQSETLKRLIQVWGLLGSDGRGSVGLFSS